MRSSVAAAGATHGGDLHLGGRLLGDLAHKVEQAVACSRQSGMGACSGESRAGASDRCGSAVHLAADNSLLSWMARRAMVAAVASRARRRTSVQRDVVPRRHDGAVLLLLEEDAELEAVGRALQQPPNPVTRCIFPGQVQAARHTGRARGRRSPAGVGARRTLLHPGAPRSMQRASHLLLHLVGGAHDGGVHLGAPGGASGEGNLRAERLSGQCGRRIDSSNCR